MELSALSSQTTMLRHSLDVQLITNDDKKIGNESDITVKRNWRRVLTRSVIHLAPVAVTAYILQLNFRRIYWRDSNDKKLNEYLGALQVAAKLHEVLIIYSLSQVVLYNLQRNLVSCQGVPFGLFSSAYHTFLGGYPFTLSYFHSWATIFGKRASRSTSTRGRWLGLAFLVLLVALLSLAVGPSSAIVVIPRLGWWDYDDVFRLFNNPRDPFKQTKDFEVYIPTLLFPEEVTNASLPGACMDANTNTSVNCPFAGLNDMIPTFDFREGRAGTQNVTLGINFGRKMYSAGGSIGINFASASSVSSSFVLADYLSLSSPQAGATYLLYTLTPYIAQLHTSPSIMGPGANVMCVVESNKAVVRNFSSLTLDYDQSTLANTHLDLRTIWNESTLARPPRTMVSWKDVSHAFGKPKMLSIVLRPEDDYGTANVSLCAIDATWTPLEEWAMSSGSAEVVSNYTVERLIPSYPMRIDEGWIKSFDASQNNTNSTVIESFVDDGLKVLTDARGSYLNQLPAALALILSKGITDGLSRIGSEYVVNSYLDTYLRSNNVTVCREGWCSQGPYAKAPTGPAILNGTFDDYMLYFDSDMPAIYDRPFLTSFPAPHDIDEKWTRISFRVKRYGYRYGFDTSAVKIAAAILLLDVAIVLVHSVATIVDGRTFGYGQSLGELLALAVNSPPTKGFNSGPEGISSSSAWRKTTSVERCAAEDGLNRRLQIVVDE
jgi:hypothetical protein